MIYVIKDLSNLLLPAVMGSTQPNYIYHVKVRYFLHMRFRVETLYYQMAVLNSKDPTTAVDNGKLF